MYPIFTCFAIFSLFTFLYMRRSSTKSLTGAENMLEREREANSVRKQPLTDLNYINVDLSKFPELNTEDEYLLERIKKLTALSDPDVKIVNLSAYTNTDLKLKYGVANITVLTEYDQNFTNLCRCLFEIGKRLHSANDIENALTFLEYGINCGTDLKSHYTLLADIYESQLQYGKIVDLIHSAKNINSALKDSLIRDLNSRLEGTGYSESDSKDPLEDVSIDP